MSSAEDPTEASAVARQEKFLAGRVVTERNREVHEDSSNSAVALVATIDQYAETIEPLSTEEEEGFLRNAGIAHVFVETFAGPVSGALAPTDMDRAFAGWLVASERHGYTDQAAVAVLGSAFGKYCAQTLRMHWVQVREAEHISFAVRADDCDVRAYPFDMISKRLPNRETGFFGNVYLVLKNRIAESRLLGDA